MFTENSIWWAKRAPIEQQGPPKIQLPTVIFLEGVIFCVLLPSALSQKHSQRSECLEMRRKQLCWRTVVAMLYFSRNPLWAQKCCVLLRNLGDGQLFERRLERAGGEYNIFLNRHLNWPFSSRVFTNDWATDNWPLCVERLRRLSDYIFLSGRRVTLFILLPQSKW